MTKTKKLLVSPENVDLARRVVDSEVWPDVEIVPDIWCPSRSYRRRAFWEWLRFKKLEFPRIGYMMGEGWVQCFSLEPKP